VRLSFGEKTVLDGVSFEVRRAETVLLLGESGGGKSMLLRTILGLQEPDGGSVRLLGVDVVGAGEAEWEPVLRRIGIVYQSSALYSGLTVEENVALELREVLKLPEADVARRVRRSLEAVGLGDTDPSLLPEALSGGMRKRLAVARAIAPEPEVLFYDEPTSGLDPILSARILALIGDLDESYGVTSLVVTHDVRGATGIADRILLLAGGRIAFDGAPGEFESSGAKEVRAYLDAAPGFAPCAKARPRGSRAAPRRSGADRERAA
jgi:phospholipid/cholesterol/gamma-HCH transport system ATP-binding protein